EEIVRQAALGRGFAFVSQQLKLTSDQQEVFYELVDKYRKATDPFYQQLNTLQYEVADELSKAAPDTIQLNRLSDEISLVQSQIKKETNRHIINVKKICSNDQSAMLGQLYRSIIDESATCRGQGSGQGRGNGKGGPRHRYRGGN
ncbi:MAG: hypothetical protein CVU06_10335, partial [Bacteroidetes bacterium HGW-Bacteroidetes-22]